METINLFFIHPGYYECIVTTKDNISTPYDRKIVVDLQKAKKWNSGVMVSTQGSYDANPETIANATDEFYYFIDCRQWIPSDPTEIYLSFPKRLTDGKEYYTKSLKLYLEDGPSNLFLFPTD